MTNLELLKMAGFHPPITGRFCPPADSLTMSAMSKLSRASGDRQHCGFPVDMRDLHRWARLALQCSYKVSPRPERDMMKDLQNGCDSL